MGRYFLDSDFIFCCCLFCFVFAMESVTLLSKSFSPDLCLEEDLNHAMANCFEALIGEFFQNPNINMKILFTAIQIFLMILLGRI